MRGESYNAGGTRTRGGRSIQWTVAPRPMDGANKLPQKTT